MKRTLILARLGLLAFLLTHLTGCSSPYLKDRASDAADIFTFAAGVGAGGKARLGPIQAGLVYQKDAVGLRNGTGFASRPSLKMAEGSGGWDLLALYFGGEQSNQGAAVDRRKKGFKTMVMFVPTGWWDTDTLKSVPCHYLTQIEVAGGAGFGFRFAFNPGELFDFLLGWATLDLFRDDVARGAASTP